MRHLIEITFGGVRFCSCYRMWDDRGNVAAARICTTHLVQECMRHQAYQLRYPLDRVLSVP